MEAITNVFAEVAELANRLGVTNIKDLPGCWEYDLANGWKVAVNGHDTPMAATFSASIKVPPMHALFINPAYFGAILLASPVDGLQVGGTEADVIAALRQTAVTP